MRQGKAEKLAQNFYGLTGKVFDVFILNLLWLVCSIPLVTMGAAFCALYETAGKCIRDEKGYVAETFFKSFRRNLFPGCILWLIVVLASFFMHLNLGIVWQKFGGNLQIFMLMFYGITAGLIVGMACYLFPALSRFDMNAGWLLKLAVFMTFRYFPVTLLLTGGVVLSAFLLLKISVLIFILPAAAAVLHTKVMEPLLLRHYPKTEDTMSESFHKIV